MLRTFCTLVAVSLPFAILPGEAAAVSPDVLAAQASRVDTIHQIAPAVVAIFAANGQGGGSGVVVSADGYCVTNFHVVDGQGNFLKCGLNDGKVYDAVLVNIDPTGDVALIKLLGRDDFPHATIGDSDRVRVGDGALALGNPFLLATDFQPTVTYGMVSGVHRYQYPAGTFLEYTDCLQVDTSINPGNSGGPLFNEQGELIGINGRISVEKRGRVNVGAGYAISINQVMNFLDHLKSGRIVDHATLGATVVGSDDGSVRISSILEQSEAFRRGLRSGDELISFAGRPIRSVNQFKNILGIYPKGWKLPLSYRREGERHEIVVRLRALHRAAEFQNPEAELPEQRPDGPDDPEKGPEPRVPIPHRHEAAPPPPEYAHLFAERSGFANYAFNRLERDRVLASLAELGDFRGRDGLWTLTGTTSDGRPFQFKLAQELAAVSLGGEVSLQPATEDFADRPAESGGLLAALVQLKQLLVNPNGYFTEFYYLGSEPLDGVGERVDVVVTTRGTLTCRWYFPKSGGLPLGFDTAIAEDADDCEIRFDGFAPFGDRKLPARWTVRHAGEPVGQFTVDAAELTPEN